MVPDRSADRAAVRGVSLLFLGNGLLFSSLVPRFPDLVADLGIGLDTLGVLLMVASVGGMVGAFLAARWSRTIEPRRFALASAGALAVALSLLGFLDTMLLPFGVWMVVLGAADSVADIGMNLLATDLDRRSGRSLIHRFHAIWSLGTLLGAGIGAVGAAVDLDLGVQLVGVAALQMGLAVAGRGALPAPTADAPTADAPPTAAATAFPVGGDARWVGFLLVVAAAVTAWIEGTPSQWSSLFGVEVHGASDGVAGIGYAAATLGMVVGRLGGDRLTDRHGQHAVHGGALLLTALATVVVVGSPGQSVAVVGMLLAGLGSSVLFPALYLRAANQGAMGPGAGLAAMTTGLRLGFLSGPLAMGVLGESVGLRTSWLVVMTVAVVVALVVRAALRVEVDRLRRA